MDTIETTANTMEMLNQTQDFLIILNMDKPL